MAFNLPDGSWSYYIVNNGEDEKKIAIVNENDNKPLSLNCYRVIEAEIPENRECRLPDSYGVVDTKDGVAYASLPPKSFVVLSNKGVAK